MPYTDDGTPYTGDLDTIQNSIDAAISQTAESKMSGREKVLNFLQKRGASGATDEEIERYTGLKGSTARPRRIELETEGLVRAMVLADELKSGNEYRRKTKSGRVATVWVLTSWLA